jgi:hypothetical protein
MEKFLHLISDHTARQATEFEKIANLYNTTATCVVQQKEDITKLKNLYSNTTAHIAELTEQLTKMGQALDTIATAAIQTTEQLARMEAKETMMQTTIASLEAQVSALQTTIHHPEQQTNEAATVILQNMEQRQHQTLKAIDILTEIANRPTDTAKPTPTDTTTPDAPKPKKKTNWSEVVSKKDAKQPTPPTKKQRTIVVHRQPTATEPLDPLKMRDAINTALEQSKAPAHLRVATVTANHKNNIVLTTREDCTANTLLEFKATILQAITSVDGTPTNIQASKPWFKIMVHGIDTQRYPDNDSGMKTLQREIESLSTLKLTVAPRYASRPESRLGKTASSVVICLDSAEDATHIINHRIAIDGTLHRTERFWAVKPTNQCHLCQGFGHHSKRCNQQPRCRLCAGDHLTTDHRCVDCPILKGRSCMHTATRCCNCKGAHRASDATCPKRPATAGTKTGDEREQEGVDMEM